MTDSPAQHARCVPSENEINGEGDSRKINRGTPPSAASMACYLEPVSGLTGGWVSTWGGRLPTYVTQWLDNRPAFPITVAGAVLDFHQLPKKSVLPISFKIAEE